MSLLEASPDKFQLTRGRVLYNPAQTDEHAVITKRNTLDLTKEEDQATFNRLKRKYGAALWNTKRSAERSANTKIIPLNSPTYTQDGESKQKRYAHILSIQVTSGPREDEIIYYVIYTNSDKFDWDINPSTAIIAKDQSKEINPENFSRLPTTIDNSVVSKDKAGPAINYWQPFYSSKKTSQAVDRIKPSNISGLANNDLAFNKPSDLSSLDDKKKQYWEKTFGKKIDSMTEKQKETAVNDYLVKQIKNPGRIGLQQINQDIQQNTRIQQLILGSRARTVGKNYQRSFFPQKKKQFLSDLLEPFIANPNNPRAIYPLEILDDSTPEKMMSKVGIQDTGSITSDFMEVIHPIALMTGNTTGNAQRMVLEFLGAKSYAELQKNALISYGGTSTEQLVDSYILNQVDGKVRKLMISSKSGGGMPAKLRSLKVAYDEVMRNPTARKMFEDEILDNSDIRYIKAWNFIETIMDSTNYLAAFDLATKFRIATSEDAQLFEKLVQQYGLEKEEPVDTDDEDSDDEQIKEGKHQVKKIPDEIMRGFSNGVKAAYKSAEENSNQVARLVNGLWKTMIVEIQSSPAFSNIVSWLFNHSATVQVNTHSSTKGNRFVLNNITATWPSQAVERADLVIEKKGIGVSFKIMINGYQEKFGTDDTGLSDRAGTVKDIDPLSKNIDTSDWASPDNIEDGKVSILKALLSAGKLGVSPHEIAINQINTWKWAGSNYTLAQIQDYGITGDNYNDIVNKRSNLIKLISSDAAPNKVIASLTTSGVKAIKDLLTKPRKSRKALQEDDDAKIEAEKEAQGVKAALVKAYQDLLNVSKTDKALWQTLVGEVNQPRVRGQRKAKYPVANTNPGFNEVLAFFNKYGVTAHANLTDLVSNILKDKLSDTREIMLDFRQLLSNPIVQSIINQETKDTLSELLSENIALMERNPPTKLNQETVNEYLTLLYWTMWLYNALHVSGADKTAATNAVKIVGRLCAHIRPGWFEKNLEKFLSKALSKMAAAPKVNRAPTVSYNQISNPNGEIAKLRARMTPANRKEFDEQMSIEIENGESLETIIDLAKYYAGINESKTSRRSMILTGILG